MQESIHDTIKPKMDTANTINKSSTQGVTKADKRERKFKLSLFALVSGKDASGNEFKERAQLHSISADSAKFQIKSQVTVGSELNISLSVPKTLFLENPFDLLVSGRVILVLADPDNKVQNIMVKLNRTYKILSHS
jgi:hypothetical protein